MNSEQKTSAVAYIRMSSSKQEASPEQQRTAISRLAKQQNCSIVREYFDSGISGAETKNRKQFTRMITDVRKRRDFDVILAWDQDRFSRGDSIDVGEIVAPLRRAGIRLITVAQGEINWNDFAGRMVYSIQQEGKNQFLVDLSRNVLRGILKAAADGKLCCSQPYGYDRVIFDTDGNECRRVHFGEKFQKPSGWMAKLAVSDDAAAVETVRWIFNAFLKSDRSIRSLATELNARGTPSPRGTLWTLPVLSAMLRNPTYAGDFRYGCRGYGKFFQAGSDGSPTQPTGERIKSPAVFVRNAHEPLVSRDLFDRVQAKLRDRSRRRSKPRSKGHLLTGILKCGHCGNSLYVGRYRRTRRVYRCKGAQNGSCKHYSIDANMIEEYLTRLLQGAMLSPTAMKQLRAEVLRQAQQHNEAQPSSVTSLRASIDSLDRKIKKGTETLLLAAPDDIADASALLAEWRNQRASLQAQLSFAELPAATNHEELADRAMSELHRLSVRIQDADTDVARQALLSILSSVILWWHEAEKPGAKRPFAKGLISLRPNSYAANVQAAV
jgi:DNA invertase Pin-like site-specific DNA recombinase